MQLPFNFIVYPCVNHKALINADRRSTYLTVVSKMSRDNGFWVCYHFVGAEGARMPEKCISWHRCDTGLSGWLNDCHLQWRMVKFLEGSPFPSCPKVVAGSYWTLQWSTVGHITLFYRFVTRPKCPVRYSSID